MPGHSVDGKAKLPRERELYQTPNQKPAVPHHAGVSFCRLFIGIEETFQTIAGRQTD
jgi:hypothetical protein